MSIEAQFWARQLKKLVKQCGYWAAHRRAKNLGIPFEDALRVFGYPQRNFTK